MSDKKPNDILRSNIIPFKRAEAAYEIFMEDGTIEHSVFQHSALCQTYFPYRSLKKDQDYWKREQGKVVLSVQAMKVENPTTGKTEILGIPYGPKIRLIMAFINTEIIRSKGKTTTIEVEDSMTRFIKNNLGLNTDGRTIRAVKEQLSRLATCMIAISFVDKETAKLDRRQGTIIDGFDLWFPKDEKQRVLWTSHFEVSERYAQSLVEHAVPLDMRAVAALANNAMALDIYAWLAQRAHRVDRRKPAFIHWQGLYEQFGFGYGRIRDFRKVFLENLKIVHHVYRDLKVELVDRKSGQPAGIYLFNSPPPIRHKMHLPSHFGTKQQQTGSSGKDE